ncbi:MAG TPA: DUF488 family protein [Alphaproteobacteria bacterium]|jgi:uncharacterized protein YeaO (DUF488 family)
MPLLIEKSAYSPAGTEDGLRLLVTRFKPYGLGRKDWNLWLTDLAPSAALVKGFHAGKLDWKRFAAAYRKEVGARKSLLRLLRHMSEEGRPITLLCACEKPDQCHRRLLRDAIAKA